MRAMRARGASHDVKVDIERGRHARFLIHCLAFW